MRSSKLNLGSISHSKNKLIGIWLSNLPSERQFADLVCITFEALGLQMTTIAQNDLNYLRIFHLEMDRFWPDLQLFKFKIKQPVARAECDQIQKMGQIICFYVNTHVLKGGSGYFVTFSHG